MQMINNTVTKTSHARVKSGSAMDPCKIANPSTLLSLNLLLNTHAAFTGDHGAVQPCWPVVMSPLKARQHRPGHKREVAAISIQRPQSAL